MTPEGRIRVLFIDDDNSIRIFAEAMFNNHIFDIRVVSSTAEADQALKSSTFDVIVCDVMMPAENGIQFCNRLKKADNNIPFIFLSAISQPDSVSSGLAAGANAYFVKPFDAKELQHKILSLVTPPKPQKALPPKEVKKKSWFR